MEKDTLLEKLKDKFIFVAIFIAVLYVVYALDFVFPLKNYGIVPRTITGLIGIVFSPFLHANIFHLLSNTAPLFILTLVLVIFYEKKAFVVIPFIIIVGGLCVWVFGRSANHIGASGLVYGLAGFLIAYGFMERNIKSLIISIIIVLLYGSLIFGVLPTRFWISWEGHLFGAIAGIGIAYLLKKTAKEDTSE